MLNNIVLHSVLADVSALQAYNLSCGEITYMFEVALFFHHTDPPQHKDPPR